MSLHGTNGPIGDAQVGQFPCVVADSEKPSIDDEFIAQRVVAQHARRNATSDVALTAGANQCLHHICEAINKGANQRQGSAAFMDSAGAAFQ